MRGREWPQIVKSNLFFKVTFTTYYIVGVILSCAYKCSMQCRFEMCIVSRELDSNIIGKTHLFLCLLSIKCVTCKTSILFWITHLHDIKQNQIVGRIWSNNLPMRNKGMDTKNPPIAQDRVNVAPFRYLEVLK